MEELLLGDIIRALEQRIDRLEERLNEHTDYDCAPNHHHRHDDE